MNPSTLIGIFASILLLVSVLFFTAESPESFLNLPGLAIVVTGTLAATFISYPLKEVLRVVRLVGLVFRRENTYVRDDINELVSMSRLWFKGDVRAVERELENTRNPFLRTGIQLVIANTKEDEIFDMLRWRIARLKAREHAEAQIFRTMATYAPAFGMIGTLVGLVNMLEVMDSGNLDVIGPRMAVALLTTFYGILLANLVFKPVAVKLERRTEERLITMNMVLEGISLITKRRLPSFIEETLNSFIANYHDEIREPDVKKPRASGSAPRERVADVLDRDTRHTLEAPLPKGSDDDGWLTSYLDVLTLLLTLFVLLLSLAPPGGNDEGAAGSVAEVSPGAIEDLPLATLAAGIQPRHSGLQPRFDGISIPGVDVSQGQEGVTLRINDSLLFDSGRARLTGQGRDLVASLVEVLNAFEGQVSVEGHTDNVPISTSRFPSNWELSSARAIAVVRHLESLGLNVSRMRAVGYADTQPMESNATSPGRAANRRVELLLRQPSRGE